MAGITQSVVKTALADRLAASGATLGPYGGAETAKKFSGVESEFAAITTGCGVYDLGWRGKITASGEDRTRWLNGMVTNNVKDLPLNHGNYNFVLSPQGRILGDLYVYNRGTHLQLDTELSQVAPLLTILNRFIIMDEVELADASEQLTSIGLQGPHSQKILEQVGINPDCADSLVVCEVSWKDETISITRMVSEDYLTYEMWLAPSVALKLWDAFVEAGATPTGTAALEKFRVMAGVPRYGQDITERYLPQETEQSHALNFTKGCYIGQEIVERIRARGQVHRGFAGFVFDAEVEPGSKISADGKEVGEITSVEMVRLPGTENAIPLALGYIRREAEKSGTQVQVGETKGRVAKLPFKK